MRTADVKYLTLTMDTLEGEPTAILTCASERADLPSKHMIVPAGADAGHVAAMAQYLAGMGDAEVTADEPAAEFLRSAGFADNAKRRGVAIATNERSVIMTSVDATCQVEIVWPESIPASI
jgi:hypothetical protein